MRDFCKSWWKIGIVDRLVKTLSSQRIGLIISHFSSYFGPFRQCSHVRTEGGGQVGVIIFLEFSFATKMACNPGSLSKANNLTKFSLGGQTKLER
jgi:hypothetical protein